MSNTIANGLSSLKNAQMNSSIEVKIKYSKFMLEILKVLRDEGYIRGFSLNKQKIFVYLKYFNKRPVLSDIKIISKSSRRVYLDVPSLIIKNNEPGTYLVSTSLGLLSSLEAVKRNIGGEVICHVI